MANSYQNKLNIFYAFCKFFVKSVQEKNDNKNNHVVGIYVQTLSNNFIKYHWRQLLCSTIRIKVS